MNRFKFILTVLVLFIYGDFSVANACQCLEWSGKELQNRASVIFVGTVIENSCEDQDCPTGNQGTVKLVTFKEDGFWKGVTEKEVIISFPAHVCCVCGIATKTGDQLLIFAFDSIPGGYSQSSGCTSYPLKNARACH